MPEDTSLMLIERAIEPLAIFENEYRHMVNIVRESHQEVSLAISQHGKSHSQFQYALLDCAGPIAGFTKLRNWRQVLATIDRTKSALIEAELNLRATRLKHEMTLEAIDRAEGRGRIKKAALLRVRADKYAYGIDRARDAMAGALRKLTTYILQFQELERQIREELGKAPDEPITEEDFEKDEERFHIMKAFQQALQAARALRRIDHGNMIYLDDIGISGTLAQEDIDRFLRLEADYLERNRSSDGKLLVSVHSVHDLEVRFLHEMGRKYAGCSIEMAKKKGMLPGIQDAAVLKLPKAETVSS